MNDVEIMLFGFCSFVLGILWVLVLGNTAKRLEPIDRVLFWLSTSVVAAVIWFVYLMYEIL